MSAVLVIGAGLLGTSVGLALRRQGVDVLLVDAVPGRAQEAAELGAGRALEPVGGGGLATGPELAAAVAADGLAGEGVDCVVVATPPGVVASQVVGVQRAGIARVVTDVASVKERPVREVRELGGDLSTYVAGHPLAGSERSGPQAGRGDLFEGRPWVLTPTPDAGADAVSLVRELAELCGAVPVDMTPESHDAAVAVVSHVPHVLAVLAAARLADAGGDQVAIAGQGVRDVTRIAAGDPALWREILRDNAAPVRAQLEAVREDLDSVIRSLSAPDADGVTDVLRRGNAGQSRIPGKHGGPATPYVVVPVLVPDRPGELARLFSESGEAGVNIEDLRIEHSPGQPVGLVEVYVRPEAADELTAALRGRGWVVHR